MLAQGETKNLKYASFFRRFAAYFLDSVFLFTFTFVVLVIAFNQKHATLLTVNNLESSIWLIYGLHLSASLGYFTLLIGNGGMTLGKRIMGIKVIRVDGSPMSFGRAFIRAVGYLISALFLYVGFLIMLLDSNSQTFHDKISGAYVVEID